MERKIELTLRIDGEEKLLLKILCLSQNVMTIFV